MERLASLVRQLQGVSKVAFPFAAGWANFGGTFETVTYSMHGRVVRLQGLATNTSGLPAAGDVLGTLPPGFRPAATLVFEGAAQNAFARIDVQADGQVVLQVVGVAGETDYVSLSGVSFVVDV